MGVRAMLFAIAVLGLGGGAVTQASAQDQSAGAGAADLAVTIHSNVRRTTSHEPVIFTIIVRNLGADSETGAVITLNLHNGLRHPNLVTASNDTVRSTCPSGASTGCTFHWTFPACHATMRRLRCRYSHFQFAPAGPDGNYVKLTVRALTGLPRRETAVVTVAETSSDPNVRNNRAARTIHVRHDRKHR